MSLIRIQAVPELGARVVLACFKPRGIKASNAVWEGQTIRDGGRTIQGVRVKRLPPRPH